MHDIHKQNLNEKKVLDILNNINECLICASNKNDSTDNSRQAQMTEEVCPLHKTWKGERHDFAPYSAVLHCTLKHIIWISLKLAKIF
jgi:hypothetical protein